MAARVWVYTKPHRSSPLFSASLSFFEFVVVVETSLIVFDENNQLIWARFAFVMK